MKADSFAFVLFGATGDLAKRKILPALYEAHRAGSLPAAGKIVGVARGRFDSGSDPGTKSPDASGVRCYVGTGGQIGYSIPASVDQSQPHRSNLIAQATI